MKKEAKEVIKAWESLPEGHYSAQEIQKWIVEKMHPAIIKLREKLKNKP